MLKINRFVICASLCIALACGSAFGRGHGGGGRSHSSYHSSSPRSSGYHYRTSSSSYRVPRSGSYLSTRAYSTHPSYSRHPNTRTSYGAMRNAHGRIARSSRTKHSFERQHPCPSTDRTSGACSGYVIDHVRALKRGGADDPSNMQWQTTQDAKAKDRTE